MAEDKCPVDPTTQPKLFNFAINVVDHWARVAPERTALLWTDQTLTKEKHFTYAHFSQQSHRIATLFTSLGVAQGDICLIILPRIPEWWEIATACLRAGIVLCPCTTLLVDKDIQYRILASKATIFIGDEVSVAKVLKIRQNCPTLRVVLQVGDAALDGTGVVSFKSSLESVPKSVVFSTPSSLKPTSPAIIFFTSGTTGNAKMVLHTQISYPLAHALTGIHWLKLTTSSVYWNLSEQGWAKAAWSFFATWNCGATLFTHDDRQAFDPRQTLNVLSKFPITTLCTPATVYRQLVLRDHERHFKNPGLKTLVHACAAGEPLNGSVGLRWKELSGVDIYDGYGQTETILTCANQAANPIRYGSMGKPIPGVPLIVVDAKGSIAEPGVEGDLALEILSGESRFFGMFSGYIDYETGKIDQRIKVFNNGRRCYFTGDRAKRDEDGYLWFVGRSDDVINTSGYRVGPFEVESTLKLHPSVIESAVVASPDSERGEVIKAFILLTTQAMDSISVTPSKRDALVKELQDFCKKNAAPYKYPRKIEFVEANFLPKTISGKIKRAELRTLEKENRTKHRAHL